MLHKAFLKKHAAGNGLGYVFDPSYDPSRVYFLSPYVPTLQLVKFRRRFSLLRRLGVLTCYMQTFHIIRAMTTGAIATAGAGSRNSALV